MTIIIFISEQVFCKKEFDNFGFFVKKIVNQKQKVKSKKYALGFWMHHPARMPEPKRLKAKRSYLVEKYLRFPTMIT